VRCRARCAADLRHRDEEERGREREGEGEDHTGAEASRSSEGSHILVDASGEEWTLMEEGRKRAGRRRIRLRWINGKRRR